MYSQACRNSVSVLSLETAEHLPRRPSRISRNCVGTQTWPSGRLKAKQLKHSRHSLSRPGIGTLEIFGIDG